MGGGFIQLAAYGAQDLYLTGNPQISYFIMVYKRYTNFAIENCRQYFTGEANFGKKVYCQIERIGDLMSETFLVINLPSLEPLFTDDTEYYWQNSIGHMIIEEINVEIGGKIIDRHYSEWLQIWTELTLGAGKFNAYRRMVGNTSDNIFFNYIGEYRLYIPLYFWFCRDIGLALPLIALQTHEVRINLNLRDLRQLILKKKKNLPNTFNLFYLDNNQLQNINIESTYLYVDYIFLEDKQRRIFSKKNHQYLIEQLQLNNFTLYSGGERNNPLSSDNSVLNQCEINDTSLDCAERIVEHKIDLNFNHPIIEFLWVFQNKNNLEQNVEDNYQGNEILNFSIPKKCNNNTETKIEDELYNINNHPLQSAVLYIEGKERFEERNAKYFNLIQIYQRHTNNPINYIYNYSFSLDPENVRPSGTCNYSRIDNSHFIMKINNKLINPRLLLFARNYNILEIKGGMAGLSYAN